MATVSYDRVTCQYPGAESPSVSELSLDIADGEFLVLVGPSGCGKSTTLRMLAGLEDVTRGSILIGDQDVTDVDPRDRDIAMVFQNYALYPHMTVAENMGFALKIAKVPADERRAKVEEAAEILDLTEYLDRKPKNLSGGQRQRVAMGRAIVRSPKVFLMDEPLSNLDAKLRVQTRTQIASLTRRLGVTTVYVTHDQTEAMTMGDRVAVLKAGKLMQVDTPANLYDRPANEFVAGFIGSPAMNLVRSAPDADGVLSLGTTRVQLTPAQREALSGTEVTVGIRPEDLSLAPEGEGLPVSVQAVEELGADAYIYSSLAPVTAANTVVTTHSSAAEEEIAEEDQATEGITIRTGGRSAVKVGDTIWTVPAVDRLHLFDTATGQRLPDAR
ncbi:sn-glycerol-3-phosphate ABC transporter ATP-binding protein UgpC [Kocuria palustris]|jgi:multiple sugar transport system ATP-binding protein|uniref:ABC transporter ATP-binding protein n=1 Tax=Kocuria palustris TaxID=71999 RepID=UPI0019D13385|nr:sn-glycerol-3-phosphate ABC transporter ATP-binding protein UgpC [Kocuria palustris]MBN6754191.1 sn-glycerol-3-phosphate ABC transporter ATP-binding protein UgpC [Kocuria palustris]MBN6757851.1 sn-glycerol-3-phosphate ABC transporter ATP-binding protein UgpC [Kocuria palustris]MBN6762879.1 sn-glycerol-3-phosphate ABC transporter ATP-binding protein UgpC [Kocuria palustris]MBN6782580.1 sn-glycerol-3-phosphate ABC transporter ATP-binding protein UgpC [Kocuria palustris]MBN6799278.1 sn-glycero